jgi:hypothetical protein
MALNVQKLADRLKQFEDGAKSSEYAKLQWKPKEGVQTVRIVPYKFDPDNSIMELKFYYKIGDLKGGLLAPCTFGKPDPILEAITALKETGGTQEREIAKRYTPVSRFYAPVVVRGEEELGVRYWGFGIQVWTQLVNLIKNKSWGDITSITEGNDLDVEFHKVGKKKSAKGEPLPETNIVPQPQKTFAVDPTRKDLMEKLKDQTDILQIFPLKTYEELETIWTNFINPAGAPAAGSSASPAAQTPTPTAPAVSSQVPEALANEFEKFFKTK